MRVIVSKTFVIAEAGVNHNGDRKLASELVDAAVDAGADAVKFQTFKADSLATKNAKKADYQKKNDASSETQHSMLKALELSYEHHYEVKDHCQKKNIEFMSTAFDTDSLNFLINHLNVKRLKIPSGEITNGPLLLEYGRAKKSIILSTGMSTLAEIEQALSVLAYAFIGGSSPSTTAFKQAYISIEGQSALKKYITLLHCTSLYPTPSPNVNLKAMSTMHQAFNLPIGYSDHTDGTAIPVAAVARGASVIEKHFTLDRSLQGPDHAMSLEPAELKKMVSDIREVEQAIGDGVKKPCEKELQMQQLVRKSLIANKKINLGDKISERDISILRPGSGLSPMRYWDIINRESKKDIQEGNLVEL